MTRHAFDPEGFEITKVVRRTSAGGAWVRGTVGGQRFSALVFPEHAENREWEIGDSRISKLCLVRLSDGITTFNWDRGLDVRAEDPVTAGIVDFLAEGLAETVFGAEGGAR
jgi:hypothetical protein